MSEKCMLKTKPSQLTKDAFLDLYGGIYEHSPWVAAGAWTTRQTDNLDTVNGLHSAMRDCVTTAKEERQRALICAHPDLAGKAAVRGELTEESASEQTGAGLNMCSPEEFETFEGLNKAYKDKFGFPFIVAVKGMNRTDILEAFKSRLTHDKETEFQTALKQIHRIAGFRLQDLAE